MDAAEFERCVAEWRAEMQAWIHEQLDRLGASVTGPIEPRDRPWSMIMQVPTSDGQVWFKANSPAASFEPALTLALGRWAPGTVLTPLAVDADRGWSLLPDAGTSLRTLLDAEPEVRLWEDALQGYAALQRTVAGRIDDMLALRVPDLRPDTLPDHFDLLLDSPQVKDQIDVPDGIPAQRYAEVRALRPTFVRWCEQLAAGGVPMSIDHCDLHDGQVFRAAGGSAGGWVFIDWADASVGHPFGTLHEAMKRATQRFSLAPDSAELTRLRDAYLEPWTDEHDTADLREAARLAMHLGLIGRAMAWYRIFPMTEAFVWQLHGRDVARFLSRLLELEPGLRPESGVRPVEVPAE